MDLNIAKQWKSFYSDAKHVMSVSYRPDVDTFRRTLKIVLLGTIIIGILGFVISVVIGLFTQ